VPAARSGVASATNTVARMVAGALGVAVIGSLVSSLYSSDLESAGAPEPAQESVGAAAAIAAHLPPDAGASLTAVAAEAFSDAMGAGMLVGAALAAAAAVLVARRLA
jgi:DHA2 family multidrug resistance protein-like MFS transporter